jgi:hypothetical protein
VGSGVLHLFSSIDHSNLGVSLRQLDLLVAFLKADSDRRVFSNVLLD